MKRDVNELQRGDFDLLVVGAGVHGVCVARDAALRGLSVALIDRGDICGETSHNSLKIIHGGLRYLQHLNVRRILESIREQRIWLTVAPHLVRPLRCIMPTYGHGIRGPAVMWCAIRLYEILALGRNRTIPPYRRLARGRVLSRDTCLRVAPGIKPENLTGAVMWNDAQVFEADRAVIELALSAAEQGAVVANYVSAERLIVDGSRVTGVRARDGMTGKHFDIEAKLVVNATGPWVGTFMDRNRPPATAGFRYPLTRSMNIVTRPIFGDHAVALQSKRPSDSKLGVTRRLYFFTHWKNCSVIGTTHFAHEDGPDSLESGETDLENFVREINEVYPPAKLTLGDVYYNYRGLTPSDGTVEDPDRREEVGRLHENRLVDHVDEDLDGLISVIGIKYTTARLLAERCVDRVARKLGLEGRRSITATAVLAIGHPDLADADAANEVKFRRFVEYHLENTQVCRLSDLVLRRMDLLARQQMNRQQLQACIELMRDRFGWSEAEIAAEVDALIDACAAPLPRQTLRELFEAIRPDYVSLSGAKSQKI